MFETVDLLVIESTKVDMHVMGQAMFELFGFAELLE